MRRTLQTATLALSLTVLPLAGLTEARADGVHRSGIVVGTAYVSPYYWAPFWYAGFGWGASFVYAPQTTNGYEPAPPHNAAPVELHVTPRKATVVVDGTDVGQARNFDSPAYPLWLNAGTHALELSYKGYQTLRLKFEVRRGKAYRVHYELRAGEGLDSRSYHKPQEPPAEPKSEN